MYSFIEHPEITELEDYDYPPLNLNEGDWVWCEHFKEANQVRRILTNFIAFEYKYSNGLDAGDRTYVENKFKQKGKRVAYHRYATPDEINERLIKEILKK